MARSAPLIALVRREFDGGTPVEWQFPCPPDGSRLRVRLLPTNFPPPGPVNDTDFFGTISGTIFLDFDFDARKVAVSTKLFHWDRAFDLTDPDGRPLRLGAPKKSLWVYVNDADYLYSAVTKATPPVVTTPAAWEAARTPRDQRAALAVASPAQWRRLAADPATSPELLAALMDFRWAPLSEAIASNANLTPELLVELSAPFPQIVADNPALPLLLLADPPMRAKLDEQARHYLDEKGI